MTFRMTPEQVTRHRHRIGADDHGPEAGKPAERAVEPVRGPKFKSKWEERFAQLLDIRQKAGEIKSWVYEGIHLRLPGDVMYRIDFVVQRWDGACEAVEIKGRMREPARIKLRQAVERYPLFDWYLVRGDMVPCRLYSPSDVPSR